MIVLVVLFWASLGLLVWTHLGYPLVAALAARLRPRRVTKAERMPSVSLIVAAHNEEDVIERRLENLLALDYPAEKLEIVVASDASDDRTDELVANEPRVRLVRCPRGGKVAAQNYTVPQTSGEILAFTDANATWPPDALRRLVRSFADPEVAYVCGRLALTQPDGTNREGAYWRFEVWLRDQEEEYRRKVRMFEHCWLIVLRGRMLRRLGPVYWLEMVSHRLLRYASGLLHLVLLLTSAALVRHGLVYEIALALQAAGLLLALAGRLRLPIPGAALAYYYVLVTWATVRALQRYLRFGVPAVWEKAEGTR